jgi:UDP-N-acetylglucosamine--N-acetylmuramyl-(pentapeptide) pyrophosphoryl-undecaprenol N-acetylglucosamine transferase
VAENHQEYNARALENKGAAVVILQNQLTHEILYGQIDKLIKNKELRKKMSAAAKKSGIKNAAPAIYSLIKKSIDKKNK